MKKGKREITEETELLKQESIRILGEKENYKYLWILGVYTIKKTEIKEKVRTEMKQNKKTSGNQTLQHK